MEASSVYLNDALGSVRQVFSVVGENEGLVLAKSYDPYGNLIYNNGAESSYGFTGEQLDGSTGLVYLRARTYNPLTGAFTSRDTWDGDANVPMSYNRWAYTNGNPVNYTDPSGNITCLGDNDSDICASYVSQIKQYAENIKIRVTDGSIEPVEGFAQTVDYTYSIFGKDYRGMMWALTNMINGFDYNEGSIWKQGYTGSIQRKYFIGEDWLPYKNVVDRNNTNWDGKGGRTWIYSQRGDWNTEYWDKTPNQAYHFWFFAAVSYYDGSAIAYFANLYHDNPNQWKDIDFNDEFDAPSIKGKSKQDYNLSLKGIELGSMIFKEEFDYYEIFGDCLIYSDDIFPLSFDPGNWIRTNLKER